MKKCSICEEKHKSKGYCRKHYEQYKRTGNPISTYERFKRKPNSKCAIAGCENPRRSKEYCGKHYNRFHCHGENKIPNRGMPALNRFTKSTKINKNTGCLEWIRSVSKKQRYPCFRVDGKIIKAHRFAYEFFIEEIPKGMNVLHRCDNTICCHPDHLFLGTQADNVADMIKKDRQNFSGLKPRKVNNYDSTKEI